MAFELIVVFRTVAAGTPYRKKVRALFVVVRVQMDRVRVYGRVWFANLKQIFQPFSFDRFNSLIIIAGGITHQKDYKRRGSVPQCLTTNVPPP